MSKLTHEQKVKLLAMNICEMVGIERIDTTDGSPNWWMFNEQAENLVTDLEKRGFKVWDFINVEDPKSSNPEQPVQ